MSVDSTSEGSWPGGWVIAVAAGVMAAILARWIGDATVPAAVLVGLVVLMVFGVLLGMFWSVPAAAGGHDDHGHGHGHDDHAHAPTPVVVAAPAPLVPVVVVSPVAAVAAPVAVMSPVVDAAPMSAPVEVVPVEAAETKPAGLAGPRGGVGDDLRVIEGIGPVLDKLCHELGIFHYDQIAAWGPGEIAWMDANLKGFKGRVSRDKWVRQAVLIGQVGLEEFKRRAKTNDY